MYKLQILPVENLNDNGGDEEVLCVNYKSYDSNVIGSPVISIEAGDARYQSRSNLHFTYAFIAIAILLLILLMKSKDRCVSYTTHPCLSLVVLLPLVFMLLFNIPRRILPTLLAYLYCYSVSG